MAYNVMMYVIAFLAAYFIGNISPSTMLARKQGLDIKKEGSGNAGTTNALRVMGKKAAIMTLVVDILKGLVAVILGWIIAGYPAYLWCGLFVFLGHVWPVLHKFKGGKGVATTFGVVLTLCTPAALIALAIVALGTLISKRMSVGSIIGSACLPILALIFRPDFIIPSLIMAVILIFNHRANIGRLIRGEEPKLGFLDKEAKK